MKPAALVNALLETGPEFQGPPAPDKFLNAVGSTRQLRAVQQQQAATMLQLERSLQIERQLRKAGVTKEQVSRYIRADTKYPELYRMAGGIPTRKRPPYPPDAIVSMHLEDGREIIFDLPAIVNPV